MAGRARQGLLAGLLILGLGAPAWAAPDVNQASLAELESLPGIGPGTTGRILEERQKDSFKDWADQSQRGQAVGGGAHGQWRGLHGARQGRGGAVACSAAAGCLWHTRFTAAPPAQADCAAGRAPPRPARSGTSG